MLKIKLQRVGKKHDPSFRVVVTDRRTGPKSNKHVAIIGHYDAIRKTVRLKEEEIKKWIANGAIPTDTVHNILVDQKVIEGKKRNVLPKKSPIIDEEALAKAKEEEEAKKVEEAAQAEEQAEESESEENIDSSEDKEKEETESSEEENKE